MKLSEIQKNIEKISIENWNKSFGGTASSEIANKIEIDNSIVMRAMEDLVAENYGAINANVELSQISIDSESREFEFTPIKVHIYFPSKQMLEEFFYSSDLVRKSIPEYKKRLYLGAHQLSQVLFDESVLARYFDYPEYYELDDSRSGGHIYICSEETPEERYIHVRHGRKTLANGKSAIVAIYKDLANMSEFEQRYWHSHELSIQELEFIPNDDAYEKFFDRNYEGAWVEYTDELADLTKNLEAVNSLFDNKIFNKIRNVYCRPPVENTQKAYFDSCSELFKLVGPDNINQKALKDFLKKHKACSDKDFEYESGKDVSKLDLMGLFEEKIGTSKKLTKAVRLLQKDRTEADHKIIESKISKENLVEIFFAHVMEFNKNLKDIIEKIKNPS
ncbi:MULTISPECIES: hypothetical protein [Acinetobacter]|uniref:hypothetical protein n=1 Tax=Acinetobacter TaxID=469 RepID=UPI0027A2B790|nr:MULTISPECIES: hypothetical protein [Acinetobacter]MDY6529462.1 hypothetical protein [Acinetobacter faecalis]WFP96182.1 hypothetical protein P3S51_09625 [Acinetobacter sp. ANC 7201]